MNILLFGGGLQVLAIARGLKESGHVVDVAGMHNEISKRSRYVRICISIDIDRICANEFIAIVKNGNYNVVIPTEDEYASWLSYNKKDIELRTQVKCAIADFDTYSIASDKSLLLQFCEKYNIPHPKTVLIEGDYEAIAEYVGFPALIKPSHSAGSRGIRLVNNIEELIAFSSSTIKEYGECSLQEYIENDRYYNVMLYRTVNGSYANHVVTRITRFYPIKGGSSSFCTTIEDDKLVNMCKSLLDKLNWVGFADFDVLEKSERDYRIIEINPRVPASVRAAAISGVNFGEIIVSDLLYGTVPSYHYDYGKQLRCLGLDIAWFVSSPMRFRATPSWFKFLGENLFYQEGGYKDALAMCASIFMGVRKMLSPSFRKQKSGMN